MAHSAIVRYQTTYSLSYTINKILFIAEKHDVKYQYNQYFLGSDEYTIDNLKMHWNGYGT